jgi:hypothetical protein
MPFSGDDGYRELIVPGRVAVSCSNMSSRPAPNPGVPLRLCVRCIAFAVVLPHIAPGADFSRK